MIAAPSSPSGRTVARRGNGYDARDDTTDVRHLGEVLASLGEDVGDLVTTQIELAKVEAREELRHAADAAKFGGGAGIAAVFALLLLSFAAAWGLAEVMPAGVAFLIVGVVYAVVAVILFAVARQRASAIALPPPETARSIEEDVTWLKQQRS